MNGPVLGVVGGSGGVGASTFAAVLAAVAGALLLDLDPVSGGIDVLLGAEGVPGPRWSGLRLGGGRLDPDALRAGLPRWAHVPFLAADTHPPPGATRQVVQTGRLAGGVVLDLPRWPGEVRSTALELTDLVVLVAGSDVRAVAAAGAVAGGLDGHRAGVVVRARRGDARPARIAELIGLPLVGRLPRVPPPGDRPLEPGRLPRPLREVAAGVLTGLAGRGDDAGA